MAEKTFCDHCDKEIEKPRFTVIVFDSVQDDNVERKDLCESCKDKVLAALDSLEKL